MKIKSISVQNLENLVKQTIDTTPGNNEETIRFHQMINEEWYFKRLSKSKDMENEENHAKPQIISEQNISATTYRTLRRPKPKRRIKLSPLEIQRARTSQNVKNHSRRDEQTLLLDNNKNSVTNGRQFCSIDPTKIGDNGKVIEIWHSRKQRTNGPRNAKKNVIDVACTHDRNDGEQTRARLLEQERKVGRKLITFEAWKKSKIIAQRKVLKQLEKEKQQKAFEALEEQKKRKAILQARMLIRKQRQYQRAKTFAAKYLAKSNSNRVKGKRIIEQAAVNEPRKQAATLTMRKSNDRNTVRKKQIAKTQDSLDNVIFYSWLDQLNWILHKKYLRERRHLVRSFYCQPLYYGDATLYVT